MRAYIPILTGLLLIAVTALGTVEHGRYSNRWNDADQVLTRAGEALALAPKEFGPWSMRSEEGFSAEIQANLSYANAFNRVYVNDKTGQSVAMAMLVGPPGPTSTHVAELCYTTAGNTLIDEATLVTIDLERGPQEFRRTRFQSVNVEGRRLEVLYSWRQDENWSAPLVPRATFGGQPFLFKIQIAANYEAEANEAEAASVCRAFLVDLLPALDKAVFAEFKSE
jgi:hypothetical protein